MSQELLADFIAEAGELVDQLGNQLVALESAPDDRDCLNAVFRTFHTVKGGAGFLSLNPLVTLCHRAEDVFNLLRNGERRVDGDLMDLAQRAVDVLERQMTALRNGEDPPTAPTDLLEGLQAIASNQPLPKAAPVAPKPAPPSMPAGDTISDDEFEALLDQLQGKPAAVPPAAATPPPPSAPAITEPKAEPAAKTASGTASRPTTEAETTVRVDTRRLDTLMNLVGELVLVRNRLKTLRGELRSSAMEKAVAELDTLTGSLQAAVMRTRMQPIGKLFARFPKLTRDLARTLGKEVKLELSGEDVDLDKNLVEALADPMVHLVRNAMDHGLETPDQRERRGKPRAGVLKLAAEQEGNRILIHIIDDGAGMDAALLRRKAIEKGLITAEVAGRMSEEESYALIFAAGFSTKSQVSEVSGRGVGMDVVKSRLGELNGAIDIRSELGRGSTFTLRLPLTLAILPTLMTTVAERTYALPLANIIEVFSLKPSQLRRYEGREVLWLREEAIPLIRLRRWVRSQDADIDQGHVVVAQTTAGRRCFLVDAVKGREEIVIKPLGQLLQGASGVSGATVTGSGRIALILDLDGVAQAQGL